jgi:thiol-disulfide isomerase/thioredoxin
MMKLLVVLALVGSMVATGAAGDPKPAQYPKKPLTKGKPAPSLQLGDPAPALKASKWLQGEKVRKFEPGKVYVVEFWATWCGPCVMIMPHTAELQANYRAQGVTVIGYTARDENNTEEKVAAFVKKRGRKLAYTFAYADDRTTYGAWMTAAGQKAIPCAFVVDRTGRIVYIGHPLYLGVVVPKVLAGAKAQAIRDAVGKIDGELRAVSKALAGPDAKAGLQALKRFEAKYPPLTNNPYWLRERFSALRKAGPVAEVKKFAEAMIARATRQEDPMTLWMVSVFLGSQEGKRNPELMALAVKAAEGMVRLAGDKDAVALMNLATTYLAAGHKSKAKKYARKAVEASTGESSALRQRIKQQAKRLADELKKENQ